MTYSKSARLTVTALNAGWIRFAENRVGYVPMDFVARHGTVLKVIACLIVPDASAALTSYVVCHADRAMTDILVSMESVRS